MLQIWKEYVEYSDDDRRQEKPNYDSVELGPPIYMEEVEKAVKIMTWRMAEGSEGVVVDMVEAAHEFEIEKAPELANII